jgi:NAD(P)-dependent dehydrogenase (short-subunit alcohol dehydrogenase family)
MSSPRWTSDDIGDLSGKVAVVTGANSGVGLETAVELARHGAHVVLACRNAERGQRALQLVRERAPGAEVELRTLDLADLSSVRRFAADLLAVQPRIDVLVNNAGVMAPRGRQVSADGHELQLATNHLGHFALTGLLLDRLVTTERSRVVTVSSHMHRLGRIRPDNVATTKARNSWIQYSTTKLANLLFVAELSRRLEAGGFRTSALAAHPGWTRSNLAGTGATLSKSRVRRRLSRVAGANLGQSAAGGALPVLCAATSSHVHNGQYIGPGGAFGMYGPPRVARPSRRARDTKTAAQLWEASEELTGVRYSVPAAV